MRAMRGRVVVSLLGLVVVGACSAPPPATVPPSLTPSAAGSAASAHPSVASDLEGVWHTGVVTPDDATAALQAAGLGEYTQPFFDFWKIGDENVFTLRVRRGIWDCYWSKDGGLAIDEDYGSYEIRGDTVLVHHWEGTDKLQWSVSGDTLTIGYVYDTMTGPMPRGEEVYQRVLYMSAPWTRGTP